MTQIIFKRQLTPVVMIACLIGLKPLLSGEVIPRRCLPVLLWLAAGWAIFIFTHPVSYFMNQYYTYPALYPICLLGAGGLAWLWRMAARSWPRIGMVRWIAAVFILALIVLQGLKGTVYHYGFLQVNRALIAERLGINPAELPGRYNSARRIDVFRDARYLSKKAPGDGKILVDFPSTMFYAGGDPARIDCCFGNPNAIFDPRIHRALLINCMTTMNPGELSHLVERLRTLGWRQISPRVWMAP